MYINLFLGEKAPPKKRTVPVPSVDSSDDEPKPKKKTGPKKTATVTFSGDGDAPKQRKKPGPKKKALPVHSDMSDDDIMPEPKKKPGPKKTAAAKKKAGSDSDDMFEDFTSVSP